MAGQGQEHVVQGRTSQSDVEDLDAGSVEAAERLDQDGRIRRTEDDGDALDVAEAQQLDRAEGPGQLSSCRTLAVAVLDR